MDPHHLARLAAKTASHQFVRMLEQDFNLAPKIAQVIVQEAELYLNQQHQPLKVGQIRVVLAQRHIHPVRGVTDTPTVDVTWTLDAGAEDLAVLHQHGAQRLRQVRIQRLLAEALDQGAIASQEDLARALSVSVRTIKRDFAHLPGVGRGQTHKARIVKLWLQGITYDQIAGHTHHSLTSVQRYILTFVRVVQLHQQQFEPAEIAHLVQLGLPLVGEYLALYQTITSAAVHRRLQAQLDRLRQGPKKGAW